MGVYKPLTLTDEGTRNLSTYAHPGVVCGDVIEVPSHLVLLLVQIIKCSYCLLKAIMACSER